MPRAGRFAAPLGRLGRHLECGRISTQDAVAQATAIILEKVLDDLVVIPVEARIADRIIPIAEAMSEQDRLSSERGKSFHSLGAAIASTCDTMPPCRERYLRVLKRRRDCAVHQGFGSSFQSSSEERPSLSYPTLCSCNTTLISQQLDDVLHGIDMILSRETPSMKTNRDLLLDTAASHFDLFSDNDAIESSGVSTEALFCDSPRVEPRVVTEMPIPVGAETEMLKETPLPRGAEACADIAEMSTLVGLETVMSKELPMPLGGDIAEMPMPVGAETVMQKELPLPHGEESRIDIAEMPIPVGVETEMLKDIPIPLGEEACVDIAEMPIFVGMEAQMLKEMPMEARVGSKEMPIRVGGETVMQKEVPILYGEESRVDIAEMPIPVGVETEMVKEHFDLIDATAQTDTATFDAECQTDAELMRALVAPIAAEIRLENAREYKLTLEAEMAALRRELLNETTSLPGSDAAPSASTRQRGGLSAAKPPANAGARTARLMAPKKGRSKS